MNRTILISLILVFVSHQAFAKSFFVHEADTPQAYILKKPYPGVYLGSMLRELDLEPNWQNRQWIRIIHQANPGVVDAQGEILVHDNEIKIPLAAMKSLKGYKTLENYFTATPPPVVEEPVVAETVEPVAETPTTQVEEVAPSAPMEDSSAVSTYKIDFLVGGGAEELLGDNGIGNDANLSSEANFISYLGFVSQVADNHQIMISTQVQYKTYIFPPSINVSEDLTLLIQFQYGYGYRLFNHFYVRLMGQSHQVNFIQFTGAIIDLASLWVHSFGLQVDSPLFDVSYKQVSFDLSGLYSIVPTSDFDVEPGYRLSVGLKLEPQNFESGWMISLRGIYHNQVPSNFTSQTSTEGLAAIGYSF